ncbi:peptidoglycan-binding domain-containing protein [Kitasatospora sp. NPDC096140]|uniref:peptidoglycan-binding domain-containing protein n=1 Tax=unclassified Kitasatospora TaxID=2633591 RepID=UPI003324ED4E
MKLNTKAALRRGAATVSAALLLVGIGATAASAQPGASYVRYGNRGSAVTCVQLALNHWTSNRSGMPHPEMGLDVDGQFGDETLRVLKAYQIAQHLDPDGVVGPQTGDLLYWAHLHLSDPYCYSVLPTKP